MKKIQMVDLISQHAQIQTEINDAVNVVIENASFINGPQVKSFGSNLSEFLDVKHVIPCGNGTDALQIALMALDLPEGSEVICPAFNYVATAEAAALLKLKPVYVDVDPELFFMDLEQVKEALSPNTSAIMPVHLFGQSGDMEAVLDIAKQQGLKVIEDAAQSIGAKSKNSRSLGTIGDLGITSFFPSKNLGCMGDGGAIFTNHEALADKSRMIASHGQSKKYHFSRIGVNSRLDSIQAAILDVKLKYLNNYIRQRQELANYYTQELSSIDQLQLPKKSKFSDHVFHQYTMVIASESLRDDLKNYLSDKGIPSMIYYPKPLPYHEAFEYLGYKKGDFPVTEALCEKVLSLPMHTEMTVEQRSYIVEQVQNFFK